MTRQTKSTNETLEYGISAKLFHWLTVALLMVQFALGWLMPDIERGMQPERLVNLHISFGLVILAVVVPRVAWRLWHGAPPPDALLPHWQRVLSRISHVSLYLLLLAMPLSGWFFASARGWTITLFGVVAVPRLVPQGSTLGHTLGELHGTLSWVLLGMIGVHVAAALAHRFFFRDQVMQRMLPRLRGVD